MAKLIEFFRLFRKLGETEDADLAKVEDFLDKSDSKYLKKLIKIKRAKIKMKTIDFIYRKIKYPIVESIEENETEFITKVNDKIKHSNKKGLYEEFSKNAYDIISAFVAPNIIGLDFAKRSGALQLFSEEQVHILLLGDPGTGKTDILRSLKDMSPISSMGLGSGTSGAGLVVTVKGNTVNKGLLPMAHEGICCIDELNLMDKKDAASLYNAMEKGFVAYDKGGKHIKFDAKIKVIATANPKGDKFNGHVISDLKKQLPFDSALLTRFHLVFLIRKPDAENFSKISKKILSGTKTKIDKEAVEFVKDYVKLTSELNPELPKEFESEITDFLTWLKKSEKSYIVEITPRTVLGFMRLAKASAKMEMRDTVDKSDIKRIKELYLESLKTD